jgi:hypothetical protein
LTETKSWSEIPPEFAIADEEGGEVKAFRDLEGARRRRRCRGRADTGGTDARGVDNLTVRGIYLPCHCKRDH